MEKGDNRNRQQRRLRRLGAHHREIMSRILAGEREVQIAEAMEMHPASVSRIVHDVLFQVEMNRVVENTDKSMQDLRNEVADIGVDALVSLSGLLKNEKVSARVRFKIAKLVLDRAGLRPK